MGTFRFGPFELDADSGNLCKGGTRIRIQNQPFQVLRALVERAGAVVSREDLRQTVWSHDTFVDFEHGLNAAMNKVRQALGDSSDRPLYIETLPGQGYRFVAPIEKHPGSADAKAGLVPPAPLFLPAKAWMALAGVASVFGIWGVATRLAINPGAVPRHVLQFVIPPPPGTIFVPLINRQSFAISPDGTRLAFTATGPNETNIWIRELSSVDMRVVPGTEGAWSVFWSPDSRTILYSVKGILKQANLETGSARSVVSLPYIASSVTWRSNGHLLLYMNPKNYELSVENGSLRELPGIGMRWPQFLPGGDRAIHVVFDPALGRYRAMTTDFASQKSATLMETDSRVQYAPPRRPGDPAYLLFMRGASLLVQPFDADRLRLAGEPLPIAQNVDYFSPTASACFSVSGNGVLVYQTGAPVSELKWYDRAGRAVGVAGRAAPYAGTVRISPDGRQLAAGVWSPDKGGMDIWIFGANARESRRLTSGPAVYTRPVWSTDGKQVAFGRALGGPPQIATLDLAEGAKEQAIPIAFFQVRLPTDWSPDGRFIAYDNSMGEVWLADRAGGKVTPLLHNKSSESGAVFSPDGKWIAFVSEESGRPEVYIQAFEAAPSPRLVGQKRQISKDSGWIVRWRPDGRELFYIGADNWLHAAPVEAPLKFGDPRPLFKIEGVAQYNTTNDFQFDVTRDGQRFIMSTAGSVPPPSFTVIENWQDKFRR
jgi:Tol biopolymer transport system component/DNA-binding winged helix-turn-helix (wHTH) protein